MLTSSLRPILDALLKQGVPRLFQHGLARLCFRQRKYSRAGTILFFIAGVIKYSQRKEKSLNGMQGNVNLPGQAIIESLLHLSFQR